MKNLTERWWRTWRETQGTATQRHWKGTCPVCGRFQHSAEVCADCVEDGLDYIVPPMPRPRVTEPTVVAERMTV